jgi:hypothetical protein
VRIAFIRIYCTHSGFFDRRTLTEAQMKPFESDMPDLVQILFKEKSYIVLYGAVRVVTEGEFYKRRDIQSLCKEPHYNNSR